MIVNDVAVRVLVCGNIDRRDDGAAIWASSALLPSLAEEGRRHVDVRRCGQLDIDDILASGTDAALIIVDTAVGVVPGTIVTVTFDQLLTNPRGPAPSSSHALPIDQVLGIARQLADGGVDGLFIGVGGEDFGYGEGLSPAVRAALPAFTAAISAAIDSLTTEPVGAES
jgi:hydrogenase maturation protease